MAKSPKATQKSKTTQDSKTAEKPADAPAAADPSAAPGFSIAGQYIRDLSFENPGAPGSIVAGGANPAFNVSINVQVKKQSDDLYAVELTLNAKADKGEELLFNIELVYGGLFRVRNMAENQLPPVLMIECPRMLFPFARQVLANVTQAGGFPPLMMEPVDFLAIYQQNLARVGQAGDADTSGKPN